MDPTARKVNRKEFLLWFMIEGGRGLYTRVLVGSGWGRFGWEVGFGSRRREGEWVLEGAGLARKERRRGEEEGEGEGRGEEGWRGREGKGKGYMNQHRNFLDRHVATKAEYAQNHGVLPGHAVFHVGVRV